jgi:hypothetical protein
MPQLKLVRETQSWVDRPPPQQQEGGLFGFRGYSAADAEGPVAEADVTPQPPQGPDMGEPPRPGPGSLVDQTQMSSIFYYCVARASGKSHEEALALSKGQGSDAIEEPPPDPNKIQQPAQPVQEESIFNPDSAAGALAPPAPAGPPPPLDLTRLPSSRTTRPRTGVGLPQRKRRSNCPTSSSSSSRDPATMGPAWSSQRMR